MNKKLRALLFAVFIFTPSLYAALAACDGFKYPEYSSIDGQTGGVGWAGSWDSNGDAIDDTIVSPGLSYADGNGEELFTGRNAVEMHPGGDGSPNYLIFTRPLNKTYGTDGDVVYVSFLVNHVAANGGLDYRAMFAGVDVVVRGWRQVWEVNGGVSALPKPAIGETQFIVVKVSFTNGDDTIEVWQNPDLVTPGAPGYSISKPLSTFTELSLRQQNVSGFVGEINQWDEVRVGDTWEDVALRITSPPAAPENAQASDGVYNSRVLVTWDSADSATKYMVYRSPTTQTNTAVAISSELTSISFSDTNAVTGITNYYFVRSGNSFGWSDLCNGDPGHRGSGSAVDIAGYINDPNSTYGSDVDYNLYGLTTFGSAAGTISGDIYFSVYDLSLEPAAALQTSLEGSLRGSGDLVVNGQVEASVSRLGGSLANTRTGKTTVNGGVLALAKPSGVTSLEGNIILEGNTQPAILQLDSSHQINDAARLTISGNTGGWLRTAGFSETLGVLDLQAQALIELGQLTGDLHFADCSGAFWKPNVYAVIWRWHANSRVFFGTTSAGLAGTQLEQIRFKDPAGHDPGLYTAAMQANGEVIPDTFLPPGFDNSPAAQAAREALYSNPGLELLSGASTPLESGMVINFFGDSITWLDNANSYVNKVKSSLAAGAGSSGFGITVNRRGINGGTAEDILNGKSGVQESFATLLSQDQPDIVVMFIGINDIWWAGTSAAEYESTMREIVAQAQSSGVVHFVMATPWLRNEKPDGSNINDAKIVQFAGICSNIAADTDVIFVDLHQLGMWYLQNNNNAHLFNFIPNYLNAGYLTYDGVHPHSVGAEFLANQLSYGVLQSMGVPEPAVLLPVGMGMLMFVHRRLTGNGNR